MDRHYNILFLYTELASYFLSSIRQLAQKPDVKIHIIYWPVHKDAPFDFDFPKSVSFYQRSEYNGDDLTLLVNEIMPDLIFCSGWIDKLYLRICKSYKKKIPVLVGLDNQWKGSLKQHIASVVNPFTVQKYFTHAFVPGAPQYTYALKLGFNDGNILKGFYSADVPFFNALYAKSKLPKQQKFPRRFIFMGRYVENKGIKDLWQAFSELQDENPNDWELWCLGTGPLSDVAPIHPKIKHFGFVQPSEMEKFISETGVFVLPSHFEPWGVVVHEFAAAGFPLVLSDEVGAASQFLVDGDNGFKFPSGDIPSLKITLKKIMHLPDHQLLKMGGKSLDLAATINPEIWVKTLLNTLPIK